MTNIFPITAPNAVEPHTPNEWRAYIAQATEMERAADLNKVAAIIEKGRRIIQFHKAFDALDDLRKKLFGKNWDKACKGIAGVKQSTCSRYESTAETFMHNVHIGFLPPDVLSLSELARAIKFNRKTFDDAVAGGEINSAMTRDKAKEIARRAAEESGDVPPIVVLFKSGHTPIQIARKLGMLNGDLRNDTRARVNVARDLRKLGYRSKSEKGSKRTAGKKGKLKQVDGPSFEEQRAEHAAAHKSFTDNSPTEDERLGLDPLQKVHLRAFSVQQMVDADAATRALALSIANVATDTKPDAERFMAMIDKMLAWVPDKSRKKTGWDTDYAAKAKTTLASLEKSLDKAVERLTALQSLIRIRRDKTQ